MVILRAAWALLAGFAVMTAIVFSLTTGLRKKAPGWAGTTADPQPAYVLVNILYSFLAAACGGYVTGWIAGEDPLPKVLMLAIIVLVMSAISALESRGRQPLRHQIALAVIAPIGVVIGGLIRLKVLGIG